ncbi:MAG: ornithine carbamoyltransferase [Desulfobacterales bacterium]|nr:ornithine carbamoyltransferase [Desulfobacterales bacterium]
MKKDILRLSSLTKGEMDRIFEEASELKRRQRENVVWKPLSGKTLALIFEKPSTRTRVSFEVAMYQLGGHSLFLSPKDMQLDRGESIADTARVLSRYVDGIVIRAFSQKLAEELAEFASIPVINGLTDLLHPCQILNDIFTIIEKKGRYRGIKIAYVGDGNNVANSWAEAASRLDFHLSLACPPGYLPDEDIIRASKRESPCPIEVMVDPFQAVKSADIITTDSWVSMGKEDEYEKRMMIFEGYQVNERLVAEAKNDVLVMHCLPAHRGKEITDQIIDGRHSIVFDQAENRLHVQKAILEMWLGGKVHS